MQHALATPLVFLAFLLLLHPAAACQGCISDVPPQPADGVYHVSSEPPTVDAFWMYLGELRAEENMKDFLHRVQMESYEQERRNRAQQEYRGDDGYLHRIEGSPMVRYRGIMLRHPAAPESLRDIPLPFYRDNMLDMPGMRARLYDSFLSVEFYPQGIKVRQGRGDEENMVATAAPKWWPWERATEFIAALPELLKGDGAGRVLPHGFDKLPPPLQERLKSGRRMVALYAADDMPIAPYWEWWAKLVAVADAQCVEYYSKPDMVLSPDAAAAREVARRLPEQRLRQSGSSAAVLPAELPPPARSRAQH